MPVTPSEAAARLDILGTHLSETAAELFALPSRADAPDAAAAFGVTRRRSPTGSAPIAQPTAGVER